MTRSKALGHALRYVRMYAGRARSKGRTSVSLEEHPDQLCWMVTVTAPDGFMEQELQVMRLVEGYHNDDVDDTGPDDPQHVVFKIDYDEAKSCRG